MGHEHVTARHIPQHSANDNKKFDQGDLNKVVIYKAMYIYAFDVVIYVLMHPRLFPKGCRELHAELLSIAFYFNHALRIMLFLVSPLKNQLL